MVARGLRATPPCRGRCRRASPSFLSWWEKMSRTWERKPPGVGVRAATSKAFSCQIPVRVTLGVWLVALLMRRKNACLWSVILECHPGMSSWRYPHRIRPHRKIGKSMVGTPPPIEKLWGAPPIENLWGYPPIRNHQTNHQKIIKKGIPPAPASRESIGIAEGERKNRQPTG